MSDGGTVPAALRIDVAQSRDNTSRPGNRARSILDFLTMLGLALLVPSCGGGGQAHPCANVICAVPLCNAACQGTCGCCSCTPGDRYGHLICTDRGCYDAPPSDGGSDTDTPAPPTDGGLDSGWTPPAACALPYDVGPCDAAIPVYAYVGGACVPRVYGGCQGNENRFTTLEECLATCEGRPVPNGCPSGRVAQQICLACGPAGGCANQATVCALGCDADAGASTCGASQFVCYAGVCQVAFCE